MRKFKVYLAGPITGLTYDEGQDWRATFARRIDQRIECYSPLRAKDYLRALGKLGSAGADNPYPIVNPLSTSRGITNRDRFDCMGSDLVVVNLLGAKQVSIGTMIELGWADAARRPIVLAMERSGNVHDHGMVNGVKAFHVETLEEARLVTQSVLLPGNVEPEETR